MAGTRKKATTTKKTAAKKKEPELTPAEQDKADRLARRNELRVSMGLPPR